jgi:tetratricopeptide (TPR) repeat protein
MSGRSRNHGGGAAAPSPAGTGAAAIWITLALLLAARALLVFVPSMWGWSLNLQRFVHPALGWGTWAAVALALVPACARRVTPWLERAGESIGRRPGRAMAAAALVAALLAWCLPDRVRFVGDFLLRQGTVEVAEQPSTLFPQALPLDVLLHYWMPRYLSDSMLVDANSAARMLGAIEAALLAALAVEFARALSLRGAAAFVAAAGVFFGGYLGMFTGFSKAFAEMCLVVAGVAVFGIRAVREGRGLLPLGIAVALGITLHRSALGLLPCAAFVGSVWFRVHARQGAWRRPANLAGLAIPVVALAVMLPHVIAVIARWDAIHFAPRSARAQGGVLAAAFAGARPADLINLVLLLAPLAPLVPVLALVLGRRVLAEGRDREAVLLALLALPFLGMMPLIHPAQGLFRDWDDFAATGVTVSLLAAWLAGQALRDASRASWIAVGIVLSAAVPSVQWLAHNRDIDRGFTRIRAFMLEPPPRTAEERGTTWDFLGIRNFRLRRWDAAGEALARAAETSPSPRILEEWALTEMMRGDYVKSQELYRRMLAKAPANALGWLGLASVSLRANDLPSAIEAAHALLRLQPGNTDAMQVLQEVARRQDAAARGERGP